MAYIVLASCQIAAIPTVKSRELDYVTNIIRIDLKRNKTLGHSSAYGTSSVVKHAFISVKVLLMEV